MSSSVPNTQEFAGGDMTAVMKNIFESCDQNNTNSVPALKLVEFIQPYMKQDLSALENLRAMLDPDNDNQCLNSEEFYTVMNEWTKKFDSHPEDEDFNITPSNLDRLEVRNLPYIQSTPRASFGQKLLKNPELLNNISLNSSSVYEWNAADVSKSGMLEDQVLTLEYANNKMSNEMSLVKTQLMAAEEHNELLQADLVRVNRRLQAEELVNEQLQKEKRDNEELQEELSKTRASIDAFKKQLTQIEKHNRELSGRVKQLETEKGELELKCEKIDEQKYKIQKEVIELKVTLDIKEQEVASLLKACEDLKHKMNDEKAVMDHYSKEIELLRHKKLNLEKALKQNHQDLHLSRYNSCFSGSENSSGRKCFSADAYNSPNLSRQISEPVNSSHSNSKLLENEVFKTSTPVSNINQHSQVAAVDENSVVESPPVVYIMPRSPHQLSVLPSDHGLLDQSSEEDLLSKICDASQNDSVPISPRESLFTEMCNASHKGIDSSLALFVKEELLMEKICELERLQNENCDLKAHIDDLETRLNKVNNQNSISKTKTDFESKNQQLEEMIADMMRKFDEKGASVLEFRTDQLWTKTIIRKLQSEIYQKSLKIELLQQKLNKQEAEPENQQIATEIKPNLEKEQSDKSVQSDISSATLSELIEKKKSDKSVQSDISSATLSELIELNEELKNKIATLEQEAELADLRQNTEIEQLSSQLVKNLNEQKLIIEEVEMKNQQLLIEQKNQYGVLLDDYNSCKAKLDVEFETNGKLSAQMDSLEKVISSKDAALETLQEKLEILEESFACLKEELNGFSNEVDAILNKIPNVDFTSKDNLQNLAQAVDFLITRTQEFDQIKSVNDELKLKLDQSSTSSLLDGITPYSADRKRNSSFEKQRIQIERVQEKYDNLNSQYGALEEKLVLVLEERDAILADNKQANHKLQIQITEFMAMSKSYHANQKILESTQLINTDLRSELEQVQNELVITRAQNQELAQQISGQNDAFKRSIDGLMRRVEDGENRVSTASKQLEQKIEESEQLKNENHILVDQKAVLERNLATQQNEIAELKKILQNLSSRSDDWKELLQYEEKLKGTKALLDSSEKELKLLSCKLKCTKEDFTFISEEVSKSSSLFSRNKAQLIEIINTWKLVLEPKKTDFLEFFTEVDNVANQTRSVKSPTEEELLKLNDQVQIVTLLFKNLLKYLNNPSEGDSEIIQTISKSGGKNVKKFTLKPSRLVMNQAVSPDSPSLEVDVRQEGVISKKLFPNAVEESSDANTSFDSFKSAFDVSFVEKQVQEVTPQQEAFPNFNDQFLEDVGLNVSSPWKKMSKEDTEKLFTTLAIQLALDTKDTEVRGRKQQKRCNQLENKITEFINRTSLCVDSHKCSDSQDRDNLTTVSQLLEEVQVLLKEVATAARRLGVLCYEARMMKCWNFVTNYVAMLRQDAENRPPTKISPTKEDCTRDCCRNRKDVVKNDSNSSSSVLVPYQDRNRNVTNHHPVRRYVLFCVLLIVVLSMYFIWRCHNLEISGSNCPWNFLVTKTIFGIPPY